MLANHTSNTGAGGCPQLTFVEMERFVGIAPHEFVETFVRDDEDVRCCEPLSPILPSPLLFPLPCYSLSPVIPSPLLSPLPCYPSPLLFLVHQTKCKECTHARRGGSDRKSGKQWEAVRRAGSSEVPDDA